MAGYRWKGFDRNGHGVVGNWSPDTDLSEAVRSLFDRRYQEVEVLDDSGLVVGSVQVSDDTGRRIWWAESVR